jgi:hypothetical protein
MKHIRFACFFMLLAGCYGRDPDKTGLEGKAMPEFNLLLTDSSTILNTKSIPAGQPAALFFFGPHCPYSRAQMKEIIDDMSRLKDIHFYVLTPAPFNQMRSFNNDFKLQQYPNITVGQDFKNFFADYFKTPGVPYMAIYGKNKKLNQCFIGKIYSRQIRDVADM